MPLRSLMGGSRILKRVVQDFKTSCPGFLKRIVRDFELHNHLGIFS